MNNISGRKKPPKSRLKARTEKDRLSLWKNHFEGLLGKNPIVTDQAIRNIVEDVLDIKTEDFTTEELENLLKKCKKREAAGLDDIPPEVWKTGNFNNVLLKT